VTDSQAHPDPVTSGTAEGEPGVLEHPAEAVGEPEWPVEPPDGPNETMTLLGCTIACRDQLPAARVLRDSFLRQHPAARFVLLLVDRPETADERGGEVVTPADIGVDPVEFARLAVACSAERFRAVLRPRLLSQLVNSGATVLYLEPWVQVFGAFDDLLGRLTPQRPVALVPRVLRPLSVDGLRPSATDLVESGAFDPSVFAIRPGAEQFVASWSEQVRADPTAGGLIFDGAPALVDHEVVRDPGVGLSVWNAAQRVLEQSRGQYTVDGVGLRSVHFDGFQPRRPWLLSATYADRPRVLLSEHPVLAGLCAGYRNALVEAGYTTEQPHPFDALPGGAVLPNTLRSEYLRAWLRAEQAGTAVPTSPFETEGEHGDPVETFLRWACEPADDRQRAAGGSRWTAAVWADDPLLRREYPDPFGTDAESFHEWCAGVGVASDRVPSAAVHQRLDTRRTALVDQLGVAVLGKGHLAELMRTAVRASGLPSADTPYYPVVLRCDPDQLVPAGRHLIDVGPDVAREPSAEPAEIWVLSQTSQDVLRRAGGPATRVIAVPAPDSGRVDLPTRKGARARLGLSDEFVVGAFVDHGDKRQGTVLGLINVFFAAFPDREEVRLVIDVTGAEEHPEAAERLRLATAADPRVLLIEEDSGTGLVQAACDCVASPHRADGDVGADRHALRLLEVAAHGIPVLSADQGAVAELLGPQGARLVPCHATGEPDMDAAAAALRAAADEPEEIAKVGIVAREHLLAEHSVARAGESLRERVEHAYRNWRTKWAKDRHGDLDDPLRPLLVARHALHRAPDVGVGGRSTMAPALRKAVLKALGHYDEHIRDIMRSLIDGVEQSAAELLRRQYDADADDRAERDFDSLRGELNQLTQRHDQFGTQLRETDDATARARADLIEQHRRIRELEAGRPSNGNDGRIDTLAERLDSLTGAVERTLDRIDALENERHTATRNQEVETSLRAVAHDAAQALHRTDVLQRILLREHERNTGTEDGTATPVLCDGGLLRLPAEDGMMLPWLSSHAAWDTEVSALIDSLLEPGGVFVDVGAYVGYQTVRVLSRIGASGRVVAVEPCERARDLLRRNVEVNVPAAVGSRLITVEGAAWDEPGELAAQPSATWGIDVCPATGDEEAGVVPAVRLDRELENQEDLEGLKLSVVHVDVGGRVHRVLGGLVRLLRRDRPSIVCSFTPTAIEELGDDPAAALREFGTWGYELVPVGRTAPVSAAELLEAIGAAGAMRTVKLWLRPKGKRT
jgi:FkbM family methyltransferase